MELVCEVTDGRIQIPPMILITFVENAFKYGTSSDTDCTIRIALKADESRMLFETENVVMRRREDKSDGIGIVNCRKRLELLYPGRYRLETYEKEGVYRVTLELKLKNNR